MQTETMVRAGFGRIIGLAFALCLAGPLPSTCGQTGFGRLSIYGSVEASYLVEAQTGQFTSIGQGVAEGGGLRAPVVPGRTVVCVRKANSRSGAYTLVVSGGPEVLRIRDLSYDMPVTVDVPNPRPGSSLILSVLPD